MRDFDSKTRGAEEMAQGLTAFGHSHEHLSSEPSAI